MGIANTQMYEKAIKAMAKQRVTLEVLSYHASAQEDEAQKVSVSQITFYYTIENLQKSLQSLPLS